MPTFVMPQLGESDVEGTVVRWLKQAGDHVKAEEPLVEVETEKVNVEIPSPFEGTLARILVPEGETVPVGAELAVIGEIGVALAPAAVAAVEAAVLPAPAPATPVATERAAVPVAPTPAAAGQRVSTDGRNGGAPAIPAGGEGRFSPAVLRLAAEHHIDLKAVPGTGMGGRVTRKDVMGLIERGGSVAALQGAVGAAAAGLAEERALGAPPPPSPVAPLPPAPTPTAESQRPASAPQAGEDEEIVKPSATRLTIARNMVRSAQTIPAAWMVVEMDMTRLVKLRAGIKEEFRRREGVDLSYLPFVIQAVAGALKEHSLLNSQWRDEHIVLKKRINIGVAVGSDEGLIVPVIHDADRLSIAGLAHAVVDLAQRARARKLRLEDVQGGTFTLDNTGVFGSVVSQPIINPPQCAILSTEAIVQRPVIVEDAIAIRSLMNLCISFDHRIVDGSQVGPFMQSIKKRLESFGPDTTIY